MARKRRHRRQRPAAPRPQAQPRSRPVGVPATAPQVAGGGAGEDLATMYVHVRRDLKRIAIIALILFAAIVASQYVH